VAGADLIVDAIPDEPGRSLLEAHRRMHPSVPICVELPTDAGDLAASAAQIPKGSSDAVVVGILQRLAKAVPTDAAPFSANEV
jgi:3-polyprenyl-4-hydroxybenzoate decarboxylase